MTNDDLREKAREVAHQMFEKIYWHFPDMNDEGEAMDYNIILSGIAAALREERESEYEEALETLLYAAIIELEYIQSVEDCTSELCASSKGREIIQKGMTTLGVDDLSCETWAEAKEKFPPITPKG